VTKKLLFSVTASDCNFKYTKGSGPGGQKKNKTSSAVHCTHKASGAKGYSEETRSQRQNKKEAFYKMTQTKEFKAWHKIEVSRKTGELQRLQDYVQREIPRNCRVEVKEEGKWVEENNEYTGKD